MDAFSLEIEEKDVKTLILRIAGKMDNAAAEAMRAEFQKQVDAGFRFFLIDATLWQAIDAPEVSTLFALLKILSPVAGSVCIFGAHSQAKIFLDLTQITKYIPVYASEKEALTNR